MPEKPTRQLAAIMFADMVGYTALMQEDEEAARAQRDVHRRLISAAVGRHGGDILQFYGDGTLCIFASAVEAVECAVEVQLETSQQPVIPLRIGIHTGDIVHDADGVYGDGVNLASRIEGLAAPGGVMVSGKVYDEIKNRPAISAVSMGTVRLKNVSHPVSVFAIANEGLQVPDEEQFGTRIRGDDPGVRRLSRKEDADVAPPGGRFDRFVRRVQDRSLLPWALAYLAGAWVLLETTGFGSRQFGWPAVVSQVAAVLAVAGFFITVVITWYHGEPGRQRVTGTELLVIALVLAIGGGVLAVLRPGDAIPTRAPGPVVPAGERPSIAVLPFLNMSAEGDDDAAFLATGLHDDLLTQLAKIASLDVIARTSVMQYAGTEKSIPTIGRELDVHTILEGSVLRAGGQVRLNVQLIDARTNTHLWAETYDRAFTVADVFSIQTDLARRIVYALEAELAPAEAARIAEVPTDNVEAYTYYLRGMEAYERPGWEPDALEQATSQFRNAIAADPEFDLAYARLSVNLGMQYLFFDRSPDRLTEMRELAEEALRIDPDLPDGHFAKAFDHYLRYENAEAATALAIAERGLPGSGEVLTLKAELHTRNWEWDASLAARERGALLDPRNGAVSVRLAEAYAERGRWEEADATIERALAIDPTFIEAEFSRAYMVWRRTGNGAPGLAVLARVPEDIDLFGLRDFFHWLLTDSADGKAAALDRIQASFVDYGGFWWAPRELLEGWTRRMTDPAGAQPAFEEAVDRCLEALETQPDDPRIHASLGRAYAALGMREEAIREARAVTRILPITKDPVFGRDLLEITASIFAELGMAEEAADALETVLSVPGIPPVGQLRGPEYDRVRDHPRIQAILALYPDDPPGLAGVRAP